MRLFIAIELSEAVREVLCRVMSDLRSQGVSGNFTPRENLHITLAFIGESDDIAAIRRVMDGLTCSHFRMTVSGSGRFDDILWAGVEDNRALAELADTLCARLRESGFSIEKRAFMPHITLVRRAGVFRRLYVPSVTMTVSGITLMKSERIDGRLTYTPVYTRRL